ncbi:MAG: DHH family phosphoesterase [Mariprofundaceae bacterium]|nr:DHH family phosphoesterase [Mariprofundaceae bacterium]
MTYFDVFNGDADGICALHQLRLAQPRQSTLITGVKRDISLLQQVTAQAGDCITVLDISLDKNRDALVHTLEQGADVHYVDHHFAGDIPTSPRLHAHINTDANVCTSLLVNDELQGAYLAWAVTAAFGDNLFDAGEAAAQPLKLNEMQIKALQHLGTLMNYNGYGTSLDDLYFPPTALYQAISSYENPFDFIAQSPAYQVLAQGYADDMKQAENINIHHETPNTAILMLPDEAWTRRVSGVYGNLLARQYPNRAHALLTTLADDTYRISVRAPLNNKTGADELCRSFPTGGGRKAAAGVNALPSEQLPAFIQAFQQQYQS